MINGWAELRSRIDAALSAPDEEKPHDAGAWYWIQKIRARRPAHHNSWQWSNKEASRRLDEYFKEIMHKANFEAAALIADFGKQVPRAMLLALWGEGHFTYYSDSEERDACGDEITSAVERIAAKYGYRAE